MSENDILKFSVPSFISSDKLFSNIYDSQGSELDILKNNLNDLQNQFFIDTATWGLNEWEASYGISGNSNCYADRASAVKAKKRGYGTVTKAMMQNFLLSYTAGDADILEDFDNSKFTIKFNNPNRVPDNINNILNSQLLNGVDTIAPAHLAWNYTYQYNWWERSKAKTWGQQTNWDSMRAYDGGAIER